MIKRANTFLAITLSAAMLGGCTQAVVSGAVTGAEVIHDRRNAGTVLEDRELQLKAYHQLAQRDDIRARSDISIDVYDNRVLLTGTAEDAAVAQQFVDIVRGFRGVETVYNEIEHGEFSISEYANDAYITSKAKVVLFDIEIEEFDPTRVKVVTNHASVYLLGLVTTQEADAIAEKVRYLSGVKRVVKLFEYIQPTN